LYKIINATFFWKIIYLRKFSSGLNNTLKLISRIIVFVKINKGLICSKTELEFGKISIRVV
jgi:hypothetical protein